MNLGGPLGGVNLGGVNQQANYQLQSQLQQQQLLQQLGHFVNGGWPVGSSTPPHTPPTMQITGQQFLVWCSGEVRQCDTKDQAEATAGTLAHQHQSDAFVLAPVLRVAPKRDVVTTPIAL